jgi:DNA repair protein RadA/Sms
VAKVKKAFFCKNCGYESPKWLGKCPSCGEWNTFVEELIQKEVGGGWSPTSSKSKTATPKRIAEIQYDEKQRFLTDDRELNRVLGGGIVPGSLVLIGGEPGIGKSTLMLQVALQLQQQKVLYISGEESAEQIKMRAERIQAKSDNCFILTETSVQNIFKQLEQLSPDVLIIDSIQTLHSSLLDSPAGSISQVRECCGEFMKFAKETGTPVFLIGHITKEGSLAGPKLLEHMVDTVLQFEGDQHLAYRILRTHKNRFGSTAELGIYEMLGDGLRQVENPSEILISQKDGPSSGIGIAATQEGNRTLLVEIQALVSNATYGNPQRTPTGFDNRRLSMLLAVLEKRGGLRLGSQDVFINIAGGIKVVDPAADLAVCMAIISSYEEEEADSTCCFTGEVGLGGEIRAVHRIDNRVTEAEKLGFKTIYISKFNKIDETKYSIRIRKCGRLEDVIRDLFG